MATFLRTHVQPNIGLTPIAVLSPVPTSSFTIVGCNLSNTTDYEVIVDITITDTAGHTGNYINKLVINPYTSSKVITNGEKLIIAGASIMTIVSDTVDSIDATISYAEIV